MSQFDNMVNVLQAAWPARDQIVICLEGPVGIGKTAAVEEHVRRLGENDGRKHKLVSIIASQILPNEVSGITMPVTENKSMEIFDHFRLSSLQDGDVLFFDELLEADQLVLSACLTLIESRQMMSGRRLPDIQIVAATNSTIKPNMLKENIRQRFVWRKFEVDKQGCREYIADKYGFDFGNLVDLITSTGGEYNILTQRSLTKMAYWMSKAKDMDEAKEIARQINCIWSNTMGDKLMQAMYRQRNPEWQCRKAISDKLKDMGVITINGHLAETYVMENSNSIVELMQILQQLPEWNEIEKMLNQIDLEEIEEEEIEF